VFSEQELVVDPEPEEGDMDGSAGGVESEVQRALASYQARIADEGEYDDQELPPSLVDELEGAMGPARQTFAVSAIATA
jgi:hypothetical protein